MKYLVNRETKEHKIHNYGEEHRLGSVHGKWRVIEADPEGWIKHDGDLNPLPVGAMCEVRLLNDIRSEKVSRSADYWSWSKNRMDSEIIAYRPILDDKPESDVEAAMDIALDDIGCESCPGTDPLETLIPRLRASHKAASELPDIIAELREVLEPMGLTVCHTSPFYADDAGTEPDMSDSRNWQKGDMVERVKANFINVYEIGRVYKVQEVSAENIRILDDYEIGGFCTHTHEWASDVFRFHSRPTQEQTT